MDARRWTPWLILLTACAHRSPQLWTEPPPRVEIPDRRIGELGPDDCEPRPVQPGDVVDCHGVLVAVPDLELVELREADLALAVEALGVCYDGRDADRQRAQEHADALHAEARRARRAEGVRGAMAGLALVVGVLVLL